MSKQMSKTMRAPLALAIALVWGVGRSPARERGHGRDDLRGGPASAAPVRHATGRATSRSSTDGLHVQTDDSSSDAKAAEYFALSGADAGDRLDGVVRDR